MKKVALVTGAGSGIGAAVARELAKRGFELALLSPSGSAQSLAAELNCLGLNGSIEKESDLEQLRDAAIEKFGRIDALFAGTGHAPGSSKHTGRRFDSDTDANLLALSDEDWRKAFELYYLGIVRLARVVTPALLANESGGSIVNLSASAAQEPCFAYPSSSTIRRALSGFMKLYSDRFGRAGIRMNNVLPGYLENWEWAPELLKNTPLKRSGSVQEIANVVAFLVSDESSFVTGQDILVDGGYIRKI